MSSRAEKSASIKTPNKTSSDSIVLLRGKNDVAIAAWKRVIQLDPHTSNLAQIEAQCKNLGGSCTPKHNKKKKK